VATPGMYLVCKFVQTRRDCFQLIANCVHTADATQLDSLIASALAVCIGLKNDKQTCTERENGTESCYLVVVQQKYM